MKPGEHSTSELYILIQHLQARVKDAEDRIADLLRIIARLQRDQKGEE